MNINYDDIDENESCHTYYSRFSFHLILSNNLLKSERMVRTYDTIRESTKYIKTALMNGTNIREMNRLIDEDGLLISDIVRLLKEKDDCRNQKNSLH